MSSVTTFPSWGVSHLLSFNEPDQPISVGGSDIDAATAAAIHKRVFTPALADAYRIGAPAVARGGKDWLTVSWDSSFLLVDSHLLMIMLLR